YADVLDQTLNTGPGPYPEPGLDVPLGYVDAAQATALAGRLSTMPKHATPTYPAMQGGYGALESFVPQSPLLPDGQRVLVLITDGKPTDHTCDLKSAGTDDYKTNPCSTLAAQELAAAPPKGPILTFVIGLGQFPASATQDFDPAFLGNVAFAGGGAPMG